MVSLCPVIFYKKDRIPYFDIRNSVFDIRYSLLKSPQDRVSFLYKLAALQDSGWADT
jgi:hypothetical protein